MSNFEVNEEIRIEEGRLLHRTPSAKSGFLSAKSAISYLKKRYVAFTKKIFLEPSEKAWSNKLLARGLLKSLYASGVFPCDHTR